jgi:hypothetical protein
MKPTQELIDDIYREKVERARRTPIEKKLLAGPRLYAFACEAMRCGIRAQNPNASAEQVEQILRERLAWAQRREDQDHG